MNFPSTKWTLILALLMTVSFSDTSFARKKKKKPKGTQISLEPSCDIKITADDAMRFNMKELVFAKSCTKFTLELKHTGKLARATMGHNLVISKKEDMMPIINKAGKMGLPGAYLPKDRSKVIAATKLLGGGESDKITISPSALKNKGELIFFCSFPGHFAIMKGSIKIK